MTSQDLEAGARPVVAPARGLPRSQWIRRLIFGGTLPVLLVVTLIVSAFVSPQFLTFDNLRSILINASVVGILAVGMTPMTLSGNFVSLASQGVTLVGAMGFLALSAAGIPVWIAIALVLVVQLVIAGVQGAIVAAGLNPVVTTLATNSVIYGLLTVVTGGAVVTAPRSGIGQLATTNWLGIPLPVYLFVAFAIVMTFVMGRTHLGRESRLVGASRPTSRISGLRAPVVTVWAFVFFGVAGTLAGLVEAAQLGQITSGNLGNLTTDVVAAVLVGGVAIRGGHGSPINSALGAVLIAVFTNVLILTGLDQGSRTLYEGILVVLLVSLAHVLRTRGSK